MSTWSNFEFLPYFLVCYETLFGCLFLGSDGILNLNQVLEILYYIVVKGENHHLMFQVGENRTNKVHTKYAWVGYV